jgi:MFS family permease
MALGAVILVFWVRLEQRTPEPLADIGALVARPVLMTNLATFFVGFGIFSSFVLIPQLAEAPTSTGYGFGDDATQAGLLMLPAALCMLFAGPLSGWLGGRYGSKLPLAMGAALSSVGLLLLGLDHGTAQTVLAWNIIASAGVGLAFAAMPNLIVEAVPAAQTGEATGFNTLVRSVGSSLGSQVSSAILAGSAVAGSVLATDSGYTAAFTVAAAISALACILATMIPGRERARLPLGAEIGVASPLPEPAYSPEKG